MFEMRFLAKYADRLSFGLAQMVFEMVEKFDSNLSPMFLIKVVLIKNCVCGFWIFLEIFSQKGNFFQKTLKVGLKSRS